MAAALAAWARWRSAEWPVWRPVPLVGLALACLATRLVFEVSLLNYYFLAVGVALLLLDFARRRLPVWSVVWIVATRYGLSPRRPARPSALTAALFLVAALVPDRARTGPGAGRLAAARRSSGDSSFRRRSSGRASMAWPSAPGSFGWRRARAGRRSGRSGAGGAWYSTSTTAFPAAVHPSYASHSLVLRTLLVDGEIEGALELAQLVECRS